MPPGVRLPPRLRLRLQQLKGGALARAYRHFIDRGPPDATVLLASSARSGSTWVAELINHDNRYRVMFEPFRPSHVRLARDFQDGQYLRRDEPAPAQLHAARAILAGQVREPWIDQQNRRLLCDRRLVKEVRANLMLSWLRANFPRLPMLLLLRHPFAVAQSRMQLGWGPSPTGQPGLAADHLAPFADLMAADVDPFVAQVRAWCVHNYVPLQTLRPGECQVLLYEELCNEPASILAMLTALGDPNPAAALARAGRPSALTRGHSAILRGSAGKARSADWGLSAGQREGALELLRRFGLDRIYTDAPAPHLPGRAVLEAWHDSPAAPPLADGVHPR